MWLWCMDYFDANLAEKRSVGHKKFKVAVMLTNFYGAMRQILSTYGITTRSVTKAKTHTA